MQPRVCTPDILDSLRNLNQLTDERELTLGDVLTLLGFERRYVLIMLLAAPMLQPIPLPGVSTVLGISIAFLGLETGLGVTSLIPKSLLRRKLSKALIVQAIRFLLKVLGWFSKYLRPRWATVIANGYAIRGMGFLIAFLGILICLPLPIPASNFLPAVAIFFMSLGLTMRDGLCVTVGYAASLLAVGFFAGLVLLPWLGVNWFYR